VRRRTVSDSRAAGQLTREIRQRITAARFARSKRNTSGKGGLNPSEHLLPCQDYRHPGRPQSPSCCSPLWVLPFKQGVCCGHWLHGKPALKNTTRGTMHPAKLLAFAVILSVTPLFSQQQLNANFARDPSQQSISSTPTRFTSTPLTHRSVRRWWIICPRRRPSLLLKGPRRHLGAPNILPYAEDVYSISDCLRLRARVSK